MEKENQHFPGLSNTILVICVVCFCVALLSSCSPDNEKKNSEEIVVQISVKDEVFVNDEKVSIDSLGFILGDLGATDATFIKIAPDPEAGPNTVIKVQRAISLFKKSALKTN